jgi:anaerobic selenocysteine-containing dehydrogenase
MDGSQIPPGKPGIIPDKVDKQNLTEKPTIIVDKVNQKHPIQKSTIISDKVDTTTCYMCACRCGIKVHLLDGKIRYIEGNPDHPVNKGVLCAKGSAGIMQHYSPARLSKPLRRVGERGAGEFEEIEWDEALNIATEWLSSIRKTDPKRLAFFTGRDQSQALTSWWAQQFGTPNYSAHGGFCSVNMATGGIYTFGSAFWEFTEPDWDKAKYFLMFGVAEDHASNPIKIGLSKLKNHGAKFVSVNPIQTGYSAIADEWIGITPGTDGLFVMSLMHELLRAGKVDIDYLIRYTNAPYLVIQNPGGEDHGLFARNNKDQELCWDRIRNKAVPFKDSKLKPAMKGCFLLADGTKVRPVFELLAERYLDDKYSPDVVALQTGIQAEVISRLALEIAEVAFENEITIDQPWTDWRGQKHEKMIGRPVAMHAMRGISAHSNGFHTCRAIHLLQILIGSIDSPGGLRYKAPYPKGFDSLPKPIGHQDQINPDTPLGGPHLGFVQGPEDLLLDNNNGPMRIDKAFSWDAPMAAHGMMHTVITNAAKGDPYKIELLFMYMANMAWNSSMNTTETISMLTAKDEKTGDYQIPKIIYSDAFYSETVPYADLILPDTTYLERWDCISLLDRPISDAEGVGDSIRHPVIPPDRDVRPFQDVLIDIGSRLGLPGFVKEDGSSQYPEGYKDYITNHERMPGIGSLAGFRGEDGKETGKGKPNKNQLDSYIENGCFWYEKIPEEASYFRHANASYLSYATKMGFMREATPIIFNLYSEPQQKFRLSAQGHGKYVPPEQHRKRIEKYFDPLPFWYKPFDQAAIDDNEYPLHALTQRPAAMYHSWGSHNTWLRQIHGTNRLYIPEDFAKINNITDEDWVFVSSRNGKIKVRVKLMKGVNSKTVWTWNAIGKRTGAWNLDDDSKEFTEGFLLNHLIDDLLPADEHNYNYSNSDPITGQAAWFDVRVKIEKASAKEQNNGTISQPQFDKFGLPPTMPNRPNIIKYSVKKVETE